MTKEELLAPSPDPTEEFPLPRKGGTITLRGITDVRAFDEMNQKIKLHSTAAARGFPPFAGYSKEEITRAHWLAVGIAQPLLDVAECLQLGRTLGPVVENMLVKIAELSGMTVGAMEERETALREDPFPAPDPSDLPGDAPSLSERGPLEPAGAA